MKFLSALFALTTIVTSTLATPIEIVERETYTTPPKDKVYIEKVTWAGSGCPGGTAKAVLSEDLSNVKLIFSDYIAEIGPSVKSPSQWRKNCLVNIKVKFPEGYTYTIFTTDYDGYIKLDKKVKATQKSEYSFTGSTKKMTFESNWVGPLSTDYYVWDDISVASYIYSPCGYKSTLNINTQIRLDNSKNTAGSGLITTDSIGSKATHIYHLHWKKCGH